MKNRTWEEEMYWNYFHFSQFSLTLPSHFHQYLTLPKKFSDYMRAKLPEQIVLIVSGLSWNVNLKKDNDAIMFHGVGWEEFTNAYSLKKADVLLFRYDRRESFEVWLFDRESSCEKEASYFVRKVQQQSADNDDDDEEEDHNDCSEDTTKSLSKGFTDDTSQEKHDCHYNASRNRHFRTPKSSPAKIVRSKDVFSDDEDESDENSDEENPISEEAKTTPNKVTSPTSARKLPINSSRKRRYNGAKKIPNKGSTYGVYYKSNRRKITDAEIETAVRKARVAAEQCVNSFVVVMKPGCVYTRFFMTIPSDWELKSIFRKGQEVTLRMQGKTWECSVSKDRTVIGFQGLRWKTFARENFLEEYDVCLFVPSPSKNERFVLDVSIFRVVPEIVPPSLVSLF